MSGWRAAGSYFEVCNCDAPCSCRRIGGRPGSAYQFDVAVDHTLAKSETVSCGIPRHDHPGDELVATRLRVADEPLQWFVEGRCGFAAEFDYRSD